eukprot:SAG31_NODE_23706_length_498_cov_0.874687_1_plen_52_part_01
MALKRRHLSPTRVQPALDSVVAVHGGAIAARCRPALMDTLWKTLFRLNFPRV